MHHFARGILLCIGLASNVWAGHVAGTSVTLTPPEGYGPTDRFPGFMHEGLGASIMITELPGPFAQVTAGFDDPKRMEARGMTVLQQTPVQVGGLGGTLLHIRQAVQGLVFKKWILAADRSGETTLLVATYPESEATQGEPLKQALLSATFGAPADPMDALGFTFTPSPPFQVAKVLGQTVIASPDGQFPVTDPDVPLMVLGLSATAGLAIPDKQSFAEQRIAQTAGVRNIVVTRSTPVQIEGLSGHVTLAQGEDADSAGPVTLYQAMLFDASGYILMQGLTPAKHADTYLPRFEAMARSFRMK